MSFLFAKKLKVFRELWLFARAHRSFMLFQVMFVIILAGLLLFIAQGTVVAPFIYTVF